MSEFDPNLRFEEPQLSYGCTDGGHHRRRWNPMILFVMEQGAQLYDIQPIAYISDTELQRKLSS